MAGFENRRPIRLVSGGLQLLLALIPLVGTSGCAAFRPVNGIPLSKYEQPLPSRVRSGQTTIDLARLRQQPPREHLVDSGDVLGVFIEGILGNDGQIPPIYAPSQTGTRPSVGFPMEVHRDGTISLPYSRPVYVRGLTIRQVEASLRRVYTVENPMLQPGRDRILVSLQQPRSFEILVIRQESGNDLGNVGAGGAVNFEIDKRGTGRIVHLPVYQNDVLHALASTGGLPGLDAHNVIYVIRNAQACDQACAGCAPQAFTAIPGTEQLPLLSATTNFYGHSANDAPDQVAQKSGVTPAVFQQSQPVRLGNYGSYRTAGSQIVQTSHQTATPQYFPPQPANGWVDPAVPFDPAMNMPSMNPNGGPQTGVCFSPACTQCQIPGGPDPRFVQGQSVIRIPLRTNPGEYTPFCEQDIVLQEGDIVFVESREREFFYTGGLLGGGQFIMPRDYDLDIVEAIALAESQGSAARPSRSFGGASVLNQDVTVGASRIVVHRKQCDGSRVAIKINLYDLLKDPSQKFLILPEDRIYLRYTHTEAVLAYFERHWFDNALSGLSNAIAFGNN